MFGYVKVFQPQLKLCEYEQYKAVYCALCQTLGKRYGLASRLTLSYDFTFLALYRMALCEDEAVLFEKGRCPFRPLKSRLMCRENESLSFSADVAVLLTYHKLCDTIKDERFWKRLAAACLKLLYRRDYKRASARRPMEAKAAQRFMAAQAAVEASSSPCVDACAAPTAEFLSALSCPSSLKEEQAVTASRFGYCLGRFIYLADAAQDLEDDLRQGRFNPYAVSEKPDKSAREAWVVSKKQYVAQTLHACVAACAECLEELPIERFSGIIYNVVYQGLPHMIDKICTDRQEGKCDEKSV